jgi:hypothetical protein
MILSQQNSQAEKLSKGRGIMVWPAPDGYIIEVNRRDDGLTPFRIEGDEMDAILSLGRIRRLEVLTIEIRIEVTKT